MADDHASSEALFLALADTMTAGVTIYKGDRIVYANRRAADLSGYTREELLTQTPWQIAHPDDLAEVRRNVEARQRGEPVAGHYQIRILTKSGGTLWVEVTARPTVYDGGPAVLVTSFDITERLRAEDSLRASETLFRTLAESTAAAVLILQGGRIVYVNPAAEQLTGYSREALAHVDAASVIDARDRPMAQAYGEARRRGEDAPPRYELRLTARDGTTKWVEISAAPTSYRGQPAVIITAFDVTDRRRAEEALENERWRLQAILEGTGAGRWEWNVETGEKIVDERWADIIGYTLDELRPWSEAWAAHTHPDDLAHSEEVATRHFRGETDVYECELRMRHRDGHWVWVLDRGRVFEWTEEGRPRWMFGTHQDITARKQADEALRESEHRFRLLIEAAPEAVVLLDVETGRWVQVNAAAERLFQLDADQLCRIGPADMSPPVQPDGRPTVEAARDYIARTVAGETPVFEWTHRDRRGADIPCEVRLLAMEIGGRVVVRGSIYDISERKRIEDDRRRLEHQLQHAQKLESLGVLAGGIAHDFNNLLTSVLGYADLALRDLPEGSRARHLVAQAVDGARKAAELTQQMLAYSGKGHFVVEAVSLADIIDDVSRLVQVSVSKKCTLRYELAAGLPTVEGDRTQLRQVVMNLVINASEAIGDRPGVIAIATGLMACDRAYLRSTYVDDSLPPGDYVYLEVRDSGAGMSPETRARIFDPFFTTKFTGRGLGLAAVLGIVRGHRGAIACTSEVGAGTSFRVLFPASTAQAAAAPGPAAGADPWRAEGTVLVVDDEEGVRDLLREMLVQMGFSVLTAANGREGVDLFAARDDLALVLLDMTMPVLDGEEAFREMRRLRPGVRAVLMSGYNEQTAADRFLGLGLAAFMQKPFSYGELVETLRRVLPSPPAG